MRAKVPWVLVGAIMMAGTARAADVPRYGRFEAVLSAAADFANPVQDAALEVAFTAPSGRTQTVPGFWDGGRTWRVRFSPDEVGRWTWRSRSREDKGLHDRGGEFACVPYSGDDPLMMHGPVRVSDDRWHLAYADGVPWFWLSDTAWNGALLSAAADWGAYLADRAAKGFTAVQFVTTQWRAAEGDEQGRTAFTGKEKIAIDPAFYQRMDKRFDAVNARGLVAAPVLLWAVGHARDPGSSLPEDQCIVLARYMVARYGAHHVVWILAGDGHYEKEKAEKWKRIGRAVFAGVAPHPVTMHMCGQSWVAAEFRNEPWYAFHGYQSGHGDADKALQWLIHGPPATDWATEPHHPVINLEPNYEGHRGYQAKTLFDAAIVRRAAWWSVLVAPTAGVSYGAHGVWPWMLKRGVPLEHAKTGEAPPWYEAMHLPGSTSMKHLKDFFASRQWWRLRPAPGLLADQPGDKAPRRFIAAARADDGSFAVLYLPVGVEVSLRTETLRPGLAARWFNPGEGTWTDAGQVSAPAARLAAPSAADWVLLLGRGN